MNTIEVLFLLATNQAGAPDAAHPGQAGTARVGTLAAVASLASATHVYVATGLAFFYEAPDCAVYACYLAITELPVAQSPAVSHVRRLAPTPTRTWNDHVDTHCTQWTNNHLRVNA